MQVLPIKKLDRPEFASFLEQRQSQLKITTSTTTPTGQVLDWVPIESQASEAIASPPPGGQGVAIDPQHKTASVKFDIGEAGPAGHVPILRPELSLVPKTTTLEAFLSKPGGLKLAHKALTAPGAPKVANATPMPPNPAGYFHASSAEWVTSYGSEAWLNLWDPQVDVPSSPGDDHSISQMWIQNHQGILHSLEAGLTVDKSLNGDSFNHIFSYFTTNGYGPGGNNVGGYNRLQQGWVQTHPSIFPGIRINGSSTQGAGTQLEIGLKYLLQGGRWWLGFNNVESGPWIWMGYYPASLFKGGIANHGDWVAWGGEVYSGLPNPCQTTDQMGSGRHANVGWSHAAYQRNIRYESNANGTMTNFNGAAEVDAAAANCPANQYSIQTFMNSGSSWGSYQYFGGQSN